MDTKGKIESAKALSAAIESAKRDDKTKFYRLKDDSPSWMQDAIRQAHGGELPDDFIYATCSEVADAIAEMDEDATEGEVCDRLREIEPDTYTTDLLDWVRGNLGRMAYCTEAMKDGAEDFAAVLMQGQARHKAEIADALWLALPDEAEAAEAPTAAMSAENEARP